MNNAIQLENESILIIDDDEHFLFSISVSFRLHGIDRFTTCSSADRVQTLLEEEHYALILLDVNLGGSNGLSLLPLIRSKAPQAIVMVVSEIFDLHSTPEWHRNGVYDFIQKPIDESRLFFSIQRALEYRSLLKEARDFKDMQLARGCNHAHFLVDSEGKYLIDFDENFRSLFLKAGNKEFREVPSLFDRFLPTNETERLAKVFKNAGKELTIELFTKENDLGIISFQLYCKKIHQRNQIIGAIFNLNYSEAGEKPNGGAA